MLNTLKQLILPIFNKRMKKLVISILLIIAAGCSDGDFDVPAFDFTDSLSKCGEYVLYRANSDKTEALILTLTENQLKTGTYNVSSSVTVTYRVFNESFGSNYFCQTIPPTTPKVLKELEADTSTEVTILKTAEKEVTIDTLDTGEIEYDTIIKSYKYKVDFKDLMLKNNENDKIYYETFDFGTFEIAN